MRVHTRELQQRLATLPFKVQQSVQRRGMRKALAPMRDALRQGWAAQPRRRTGTHTAAIVKTTVTDVRRGRGSTIVGKVGVNYRLGGTRSKQRIWHLLEAGFRHYGNSKAYRNRGAEINRQAAARQKLWQAAWAEAMAGFPGNSRAAKQGQWATLRAATRRARQLFPELFAHEDSRRGLARTLRQATARRVPGLRISERIGRSMLQRTMQAAASESLALIDKHLKAKA